MVWEDEQSKQRWKSIRPMTIENKLKEWMGLAAFSPPWTAKTDGDHGAAEARAAEARAAEARAAEAKSSDQCR